MSGAAPRPTPGLTVAIVGHRPRRLEDAGAVQIRIGEILNLIKAGLGAATPGDLGYGPEQPRLRLVSALAEGADRLGAAAALQAGVAMDAILPFAAVEYERDFTEVGSRAAFRALLQHVSSVLVLDGARDGIARDRAYDAAGKALLDNCDLLIAVWDGKPGRGRGGTHDVVEEAVRRGLPVVTVSPDGRSAELRTRSDDAVGALRLEDLPAHPLEGLAGQVGRLLGAEVRDLVEPPWPDLLRRPSRPLLYSAFPLLLDAIGLGRKRAAGAKSAPAPETAPVTALEEAFAWWDASAIVAAQAFRSAVIVNFALAALAVVLAALSLFSDDRKWLFVLTEVATILLLLGNTWRAGRLRWQDRWLESREIAERLRVCLLLRKAGVGRGGAGGDEPGWKAWYVRALARASPLEAVDLSDAAAASGAVVAEVAGQAAWNEATAHRMHLAGQRLERVGEGLFVTVLAAAAGWLILRLVNAHAADDLKYALTAVTAGLPAIATASYGIRIILDFEGVAERSRRMAMALSSAVHGWQAAPDSVASFQAFVRLSTEIMLSDVISWRLLAEGRRLSIPG